MKQKGLTLVELLVVMAVLAIAGTFIFNIFISTLRGNNKTQILGVIKQNGQAVLETMDKTVRNADKLVCVSPNSTFLIVVKNGTYTRYRFIIPSPLPNPTTNGLIQQENPTKQNVQYSNPVREETDGEFILRVCGDDALMDQANVLTDTNPQTGVSIECIGIPPDCNTNPIFKPDKSAGFKDQVTIKFAVKPGVLAPPAVAGQIDPVTFQTTINLR